MRLARTAFLPWLLILGALLHGPAPSPCAAQGGFEFPVQLIGFPVIIIAVRIANFIKKLTYALNPKTYKSRSRRGIRGPLDVGEVEKKLIAEMGEKVCIFEEVCTRYAVESLQPEEDVHLDWEEIFRKFSTSPRDKAEFYLLSVFLGDIVGSPELCRQLAKRRGRSCPPMVHQLSPTSPYALPEALALLAVTPSPPLVSTPRPTSISVGSSPTPFFLPMEPQLTYTTPS